MEKGLIWRFTGVETLSVGFPIGSVLTPNSNFALCLLKKAERSTGRGFAFSSKHPDWQCGRRRG